MIPVEQLGMLPAVDEFVVHWQPTPENLSSTANQPYCYSDEPHHTILVTQSSCSTSCWHSKIDTPPAARAYLPAGLKSADPFSNPSIDISYFKDHADMATLVEGIKLSRRWVQVCSTATIAGLGPTAAGCSTCTDGAIQCQPNACSMCQLGSCGQLRMVGAAGETQMHT